MAKRTTAQRAFTYLVAHTRGSSDPSKGPSGAAPVLRTTMSKQHFIEVPRSGPVDGRATKSHTTPGTAVRQGHVSYTTPPVPVAATGSVTVASNTFTDKATLYLGDFALVSGEHFTVGGSTSATATALGAAIEALPGFSVSVLGSAITITGPAGPDGNLVRFSAAYAGSVTNYTLSPTSGKLSGAEPTIGAPEIS